MQVSPLKKLAWSSVLAFVCSVGWMGCTAGVHNNSGGGTGNGGSGGAPPPPSLPGLVSLAITPDTQTVQLMLDANNKIAPATADYMAIGTFDDGSMQDVSTKVSWPRDVASLLVSGGHASVSAPGRYTVRAKSGDKEATAELIASFQGSFTGDGFDATAKPGLDGSVSGAVQIAYPLDGSLFPYNLGPIYVHITKGSAAATSARITFKADSVDITWYGRCETMSTGTTPMPLPGAGCYVRLPLEFTQLFAAASEKSDITITARVGGGGAATAESAPIKAAWSSVALTGGLYYWTTIQPGPIYPGYMLPAMATSGTGIQRYNFDKDNPAPELVYTDQGTPPTFAGSPWAKATDGGQGTCVGCHSITTDGRYMALSVNGSDAAGLALLDIMNKTLIPVSPPNTGQPLQRFIKESCAGNGALGCGAETTFAPSGAATTDPPPPMVNMYKSKLYLRTTDFLSMLTNMAEIVPSTPDPYRTDPFWSQNGDLFAFTGFATPSAGLYNTTGLNGDEKIGGQIWVASATKTAVNDDAHNIVPRQAGITSFYPAISNDSEFMVYNQSTCGAADPNRGAQDYGNGSCDGYDDWTATLWLTKPTEVGNIGKRLDRANGTAPASNSWPRWSPDSGTFRGQKLYWIAFSSRRPYGLQVNYSVTPLAAKPQLWFTGILTGGEFTGDPSFAPVWLPNQNPNQSVPNGNHVPQWVAVAVPIPE